MFIISILLLQCYNKNLLEFTRDFSEVGKFVARQQIEFAHDFQLLAGWISVHTRKVKKENKRWLCLNGALVPV